MLFIEIGFLKHSLPPRFPVAQGPLDTALRSSVLSSSLPPSLSSLLQTFIEPFLGPGLGGPSWRSEQASEWSSCRDRGQAVGCRALMGDGPAGARKECGALGRGCPPEAWPTRGGHSPSQSWPSPSPIPGPFLQSPAPHPLWRRQSSMFTSGLCLLLT